MKWLCLLIILLYIPYSIARETITGSFTLENSKPSVSLEIVKESLKIELRDANGFRDIEYVRVVVVNESGEFSDFAVFEEGKDMDSVLDIGAIPAATWLAEWEYLSEPGFLPAPADLRRNTVHSGIL